MKQNRLRAIQFIPTKIHGFLDYIVGVLLIILPLCMDMDPMRTPALLFIIPGMSALIYSMLTKYELGLLNILPMQFHLALDMTSGLVLAFSPWIFEFSDEIYLPHLMIGLFEIAVAIMTRTVTGHVTQRTDYFN